MMKLTTEEHAQIAEHLHAVDHHLLKVLNILRNRNGTANVPIDIVNDIENIRDAIGATPAPPADNSILAKCQGVLFSDWPDPTLDTYHGSYADCATLSLETPYRPPSHD
jgi:hypothetical protein